MKQQNEPLIRMHFLSDNPVLTVDQFDQLDREVTGRAMLGGAGRADQCRGIITARSKRKALADHLLLELDDRIYHHEGDIYQAHEACWKVTGAGPYEFELLKDN